MDNVVLAIVFAVITSLGGIGLAVAALRKVKPESAKMELEGRSTWMIAQTDFLEEIRSDNSELRNENRKMRERMGALEDRMRELEVAERELHKARDKVDNLSHEHDMAVARAERAEQRVVLLETRVTGLEQIIREGGLGNRLDTINGVDSHMD